MNAGGLWSTYGYRAMKAYRRTGGTDEPCSALSGAEQVEGKEYVVLRNARGVMAVYRVTDQETLRRLRRWPSGLA